MKQLLQSAVILCAGKSTRTYPLTANRPKPLLSVANVSLLEHNLRSLEGIVREVIIVAGFEAQQVREFLSTFKSKRMRVRLVIQQNQLGTAHALLQVHPKVLGTLLVLNGDVIYSTADLKALAARPCAVLGVPVEEHQNFGMIVSKAGLVTSIVEKPQQKVSDVANAGAYVFGPQIFSILKRIKKSESQEYYLTDAVAELAKTGCVELVMSKGYWLHIGYPWDILTANAFMLKDFKPVIAKDAVIEKGAVLKGNVSVGSKTLIRSGSYIEGPVLIGDNCVIGPNCYIRPSTTLGNKCKVGSGCEVKNSVLLDGAVLSHLCYIGDSIIGRNANVGGGTITANLRHDKQPVQSTVGGALVSTGLVKFGTVVGDYAKVGINTSIYPGRKIWPFKTTLPGEIVKKDVM